MSRVQPMTAPTHPKAPVLPVLPRESILSYDTAGYANTGYDAEDMRNYATAAIRAKEAEIEALRVDAERYRWLREQHWSDNVLCVVAKPKRNVVLGANCPFGRLLDQDIDAAMKEQGNA